MSHAVTTALLMLARLCHRCARMLMALAERLMAIAERLLDALSAAPSPARPPSVGLCFGKRRPSEQGRRWAESTRWKTSYQASDHGKIARRL